MRFAAVVLSVAMLFSAPAGTLAQEPEPSTYQQIVDGAQSESGFFTVYVKGGQLHFEIPASALDRDILWYVEASKVPSEFVMGADLEIANMLVRFHRRGSKVYVQGLSASLGRRSREPEDESASVDTQAIDDSNSPVTVLVLPVAAEGPNGSVVVDPSPMFLSNVPDVPLTGIFQLGGVQPGELDPKRSYMDRVAAHEKLVSLKASLTFARRGGSSATVEVTHSIVRLPEEPMQFRYYDERVGNFPQAFTEFGGSATIGSQSRQLIKRYRLEKKNPNATVSEPVQPIVYYVSREVPEKWRPYFKQAIEDWNVAFEAAGFRNAIIARDAPTPQEDPDWDPADMNQSVVRWVEAPVLNAMGPSTADPRSGEILAAHVVIWSDVIKLGTLWYYQMAAGLDPRASHLPFDDELTGRIVRYAVGHEIGHSIGLTHNHLASTAYTIAQLRDPVFAAAHGPVASIMAYGRFNYVAQPGDGLKPEDLFPRVAPYDIHAVKYLYQPAPGADSAAAEVPTLNAWLAEAYKNRWLHYGGENVKSLFDHRVQTQNIGDDRVEATRLGLLTLRRAMDALPGSFAPGETLDDLAFIYEHCVSQWGSMMTSVASVIGSVEETRTLQLADAQFIRVPGAAQRRAVAFLNENAFEAPRWLYRQDLLDTLYNTGGLDAILNQQQMLLQKLLDVQIAGLMMDAVVAGEPDAYSYPEYMADLAGSVFGEILTGEDSVSPIRRALQREFLVQVEAGLRRQATTDADRQADAKAQIPVNFVRSKDVAYSEYRGAALVNLDKIDQALARAEQKTSDASLAAHIADCRLRIQRCLDAAKSLPASKPSA